MKKRIRKFFNEAGFHQPEMERLCIEDKFQKFADLLIQDVVSQVALLGISNYENEDISWACRKIVADLKERYEYMV